MSIESDITAAAQSLKKTVPNIKTQVQPLYDGINQGVVKKTLTSTQANALTALVDILSDFYSLLTDFSTPGQKTFSNPIFTCVFGASPLSAFTSTTTTDTLKTLYRSHIERLNSQIQATVLSQLTSWSSPFGPYVCSGLKDSTWNFESNFDFIRSAIFDMIETPTRTAQPLSCTVNTNKDGTVTATCTCASGYCDISKYTMQNGSPTYSPNL